MTGMIREAKFLREDMGKERTWLNEPKIRCPVCHGNILSLAITGKCSSCAFIRALLIGDYGVKNFGDTEREYYMGYDTGW